MKGNWAAINYSGPFFAENFMYTFLNVKFNKTI